MTGLARRLVLILLGLVVGLVLAEALVRLAGLAPEVSLIRAGRFQLSENPRLRYEPVPDYEYSGRWDGLHDYPGRSNHLGFRDRDHAVEKPPGTFRVAVLGDSVAAGQGVPDFEHTFPARLERQLLAGGLDAEVLSFAVSGYNTGQEVAIFEERGLAFSPDLVLVAYCHNDVGRSDGGILEALVERERQTSGLKRHRLHPALAWSALYRLAWASLAPPQVTEIKPDPNRVAEAFGELAALAGEHGFAVVVVIFPRFGGLDDYRWGAAHELPTAAAHAQGFYVLDLLEAFQRCHQTAEGPLAIDRYHPTARGHRCAARAVARFLLAQRVTLGAPPPSR